MDEFYFNARAFVTCANSSSANHVVSGPVDGSKSESRCKANDLRSAAEWPEVARCCGNYSVFWFASSTQDSNKSKLIMFMQVRLSSAQALRSCLDDFDFIPEQFAPYMQDTFHSLFTLLKDVRESDNKVWIYAILRNRTKKSGSSAFIFFLDEGTSYNELPDWANGSADQNFRANKCVDAIPSFVVGDRT